MDAAGLIPVCRLVALEDGGEGIRFDVRTAQGPATGFVVRHQGRVTGFLNRCAHVALELNGQIVRRAAWPGTQIRPGDTVELVHFVGGG
jgi:thiamine biosynthesis protein ThiS